MANVKKRYNNEIITLVEHCDEICSHCPNKKKKKKKHKKNKTKKKTHTAQTMKAENVKKKRR